MMSFIEFLDMVSAFNPKVMKTYLLFMVNTLSPTLPQINCEHSYRPLFKTRSTTPSRYTVRLLLLSSSHHSVKKISQHQLILTLQYIYYLALLHVHVVTTGQKMHSLESIQYMSQCWGVVCGKDVVRLLATLIRW